MVGLQLDFTPVQPSHLRHVFTPRSPASPLESIAKRIRCTNPTARFDSSSDSGSSADSLSSGSPPSPCKWMWYCHQCRTGYELGVTRRCLIDDHQLCYGQPVKKRSKKGKKKHQACQSEFDYTGWQSWGVWKRMQAGQEEEPRERNCSANCDWLSQCRWARKQEQSVENNSREAVEEVVQEAAQDDTAPQSEQAPVAARNDDPAPASKPADGPLSSIATAARKLTSQWASLLAPIPEEPASVSVEEFLDSAKTKANPTEGAEQLNPLQRNPPAAGPQSN
ncbi:MAG: hypothetical protein LQ338_007717, partial [Usnochroma carphineum]